MCFFELCKFLKIFLLTEVLKGNFLVEMAIVSIDLRIFAFAMEQTINFDLVSGIKSILDDYSQLDGAYLVAKFDRAVGVRIGSMPSAMLVEGMTILLVRSGRISVDINMERVEAEGPALFVVHPSSRICFGRAGNIPAECVVLFMSLKFLKSININMSAFNVPSLVEHKSPVVNISCEEMGLLDKYLELLVRNCEDNVSQQLAESVGASLVSGLIYELAKIQYKRINVERETVGGRQRTSRLMYVHDFIELVRAHYAKERSVAFYASKLFISPKYLSLVVKEATGRSAARWIDEFVLMEAKNMLRYSGKNIQQVAYALNFSNQSSFGKYFKHLTGMSPTEYQKS